MTLAALLLTLVVLVVVAYLQFRANRHLIESSEALVATCDQLDSFIVVTADTANSMVSHEGALASMQEQTIALRKQTKAVLRDIARTGAEAKRVNDRQYRQQKDVDDILYHAKIARETEARNG